jgi:hypothetical protein
MTSSLFKPVISTLVVKVNKVLDSVPEMPLACKSHTVTLIILSCLLQATKEEAIPPPNKPTVEVVNNVFIKIFLLIKSYYRQKKYDTSSRINNIELEIHLYFRKLN